MFDLMLEPRPSPSRSMRLVMPLIATLITLAGGVLIFSFLGKNPAQAMAAFFLAPISSLNGWSELLLKASPLCLIALGLAIGYRANVWNIGAEGQLLLGGIFASGVAIHFDGHGGPWLLPLMMVAGALGGMLWAAIPALLRVRFNANEILVSLMLTYVATQLLIYLVSGPWQDPHGMNFPQSISFGRDALPVGAPFVRIIAFEQVLAPLHETCVLEDVLGLDTALVQVHRGDLVEKVLQAFAVRCQRVHRERQRVPRIGRAHEADAHEFATLRRQRLAMERLEPCGQLGFRHVGRLPLRRRHPVEGLQAWSTVARHLPDRRAQRAVRLQHALHGNAQARGVQHAFDPDQQQLTLGAGRHHALFRAQREARFHGVGHHAHAPCSSASFASFAAGAAPSSAPRSNIAPIATTILRGPSYGSRA